jgi:hypothetical protein
VHVEKGRESKAALHVQVCCRHSRQKNRFSQAQNKTFFLTRSFQITSAYPPEQGPTNAKYTVFKPQPPRSLQAW